MTTTTNNEDQVLSPCIGVCTMSEATGLCLGCYRTADEIRTWWDMTQEQKLELMSILETRQENDSIF